jgi:HUS1 checkpoint protein
MTNVRHPVALRQPGLVPTLVFCLPLLSTVPAKRLVTFAFPVVVALAMGRTVLARLDSKKYAIRPSPKQPATTIEVEGEPCPICQEPVGTCNADGITEGWSMLPCGHRFGSYCIKRYLAIAADESPLCPMCRHVAYHDACGHPVLPFLLNPDGTHPDLITDSSGNTHPPHGEELTTMSCEYCQPRAEHKTKPRARRLSQVAAWKKPFNWLQTVLPMARKRRSRRQSQAETDGQLRPPSPSPSYPEPGPSDPPLSRQQVRARRRAAQDQNAVWEGPWMDVQSRDVGWERWWKEQAPRGA